jgi:hypothetical protein
MSRDTTRILLKDDGLPDGAMRIHTTRPHRDRSDAVSTVDVGDQAQRHGFERLFTPADLADRWALSVDTVRRLFEREPDILIVTLRRPGRRRYRTMRIPLSVAERVYRRLTSR